MNEELLSVRSYMRGASLTHCVSFQTDQEVYEWRGELTQEEYQDLVKKHLLFHWTSDFPKDSARGLWDNLSESEGYELHYLNAEAIFNE